MVEVNVMGLDGCQRIFKGTEAGLNENNKYIFTINDSESNEFVLIPLKNVIYIRVKNMV